MLFLDLLELKEKISGHIKLLRCNLEINSASQKVHYLQTGGVKLGRITGHIPDISEAKLQMPVSKITVLFAA